MEAPARAATGERVPLRFTVSNAGKTPLTLQLLGRTPAADFQVTRPDGRMVWTKLRGQTMLGALRLFPLGPGQRLSFREHWTQRDDAGHQVPPGEYLVRGVLLTDTPGGLASAPARISIESRPAR